MAKKTGLGKGLDSLFLDNSSEISENLVSTLKLTQIEPNKEQPRTIFNQESLNELADSIKENGLIQPILVRSMPDGRYVIVAGERRWRASRMAGLFEVPVIIKEFSDIEAMTLALIENLQREDLNVIEEARGFQKLIEECNLTQEECAKMVGKSRPSIANSLRILSLPEFSIKFIEENKISLGHAKVLLSLKNEKDIINLSKEIYNKDLSVRATEKFVKILNESDKLKEKTKKDLFNEDSFYKEAELALRENLSRKVKISTNKIIDGNQQGKLEIEYFSKEDLSDLIKKLEEIN
ncbi:MAG: ParB/RepB/Spo0J family partition protein [Oscillospiraceae bacterium]